MTVLLFACMAMLGVAAVLLVVRIALGPTMLDRIVGVDVLVAVIICGLGLEAAVHRHTTTLPLLVVLAMLGFVGSVSVARFSPGSDTVEDDEGTPGRESSGTRGGR
ncbi:MAG TPA: monovalent cation/H+ antiporter complex subunit F [Nocardioides sp.]|nr:monovalent cation/H+ antiporter complex subunit F [uncultured Nocardioides sp.]HEX5986243.1 monovalent cation/H+ antiporter complex subunit F [Nocardioides sp.]